jgi:hypothetical protein
MKPKSIGQKNISDLKVGSALRKSRITTQIEPTALGCHGACVRKPRASDAAELSLSGQLLRPCSRFIWPLYGHSAPRRAKEKFGYEFHRGSNCARDEGRSLGFGLQDQNPNHQLLLLLNGLGSEQVWKRRGIPVRCLLERRTNLNRCRGVESIGTSSKPGSFVIPGIKFGGYLITAQTVTGI